MISRRQFLYKIPFFSFISSFTFLYGDNIEYISNLNDLRNINKFKRLYYLEGYSEANDGGGGFFYLDTQDKSSFDNDGTVIITKISNMRYKRLYSGNVNVQWFGAKGDGKTNNFNSIKNAINTKKNIFIPKVEKFYRIEVDETLPIKAGLFELFNNQMITSNGADIKIFGKKNISHSTLFLIKNKKNIKIENLYFYNQSNFDKTKKYGIFGIDHFIGIKSINNLHSSNIEILNCSFEGSTLSGIYTYRDSLSSITKFIKIENCNFKSIGSHAIGLNYTENCIIKNCFANDIGNVIFKNSTKTKKVPGLFVDISGGCNYCIVDSNVIENCRTGIKTQHEKHLVGIPNSCIISNNIIRNLKDKGNGYAIQIVGNNHIVHNNSINIENKRSKSVGILLQGTSTNCIVKGNIIHSEGKFGIEVKGNKKIDLYKNHMISHNIIKSKGKGLKINKYANYIIVSENTIESKSTTIILESNKNSIINNKLKTIEGYCFFISFDSFENHIENNEIYCSNKLVNLDKKVFEKNHILNNHFHSTLNITNKK
jgi:parallel beta-helix repeat protein